MPPIAGNEKLSFVIPRQAVCRRHDKPIMSVFDDKAACISLGDDCGLRFQRSRFWHFCHWLLPELAFNARGGPKPGFCCSQPRPPSIQRYSRSSVRRRLRLPRRRWMSNSPEKQVERFKRRCYAGSSVAIVPRLQRSSARRSPRRS